MPPHHYHSERLKLKSLITSSVGTNMEQLSYTTAWNSNYTTSLGDSLQISSKLEHTAGTLWSHTYVCPFTSRGLSKIDESARPHKDLHTDFHSSFICNNPKLKQLGTDGQTSVILKKESTSVHASVWINHKAIMMSERRQTTKNSVFCMIKFIEK